MRAESRAYLMLVILLSSVLILPAPAKADDDETAWDPLSQPWAQYGRDPGHSRIIPEHGDSGLETLTNPAVNWVAFDSGLGADGYGVAIANLSASISSPDGAKERCGEGHLFAVMTNTDPSNSERYLTIIEGDSSKVAWEVNLGDAKYIRSTPVIIDVDGDGRVEIAIAYDTDTALKVDLWSPSLSCDESGWSKSGHSNERLWSWNDADLRIGITSPHWFTDQSNHLSVTQPLLADLSLDGSPELVIASVDTTNDEPTVIALPLGLQSPEMDWSVALDRGTHPSDPSFAALDENSGAVVLTTVDSNSGNMWIWRIDGDTGSLDWERVSIQNTDSDQDTPRLRLPGPVITQLDSDAAPEMILTLPADDNGATDGMGAQYVGMELTNTNEIWRFRAKNGYGDAEPLAVDTTGDGVTDRVCWVTWYSDSSFSTDREGAAGCHDLTIDPPFRVWSRTLQRGSGTDNDEIAVAAPLWIDIDGEDEPELLVAFGRRIFAFDGNTGTPADIGTGWAAPIDVPHRTWAGPAVADMDGDGYLDILVGDALISQALPDIAPLADNRGIGFTPNDPDPGEMVTITGQYSNIGVVDTDEPVDAVLLMNGQEIKRHRTNLVEAVAPSGEGGPVTFSVDIEATLGVHDIELVLDVNGNLTQSRYDNDNQTATLAVLEPYVAQIQTPSEVSRALPGTSQTLEVTVTSVGSRAAAWTLQYDDSSLPNGWTFSTTDDLSLNLERDVPQVIEFNFSVPSDAMGSDDAQIPLTLTLDQDPSISTSVTLPLEVERTRGISLQGASGLPSGIGFGQPGDVAHVWMMVENVGNAQETTEMQWSSNSWTADTILVDLQGQTQWGIDLDPAAKEEYLIEFEVPADKNPGDSSSTTLTLCIGSGVDEICEDFDVTVFASDVSTNIPHIRTVPATGLSWDISIDSSSSPLSWDMSAAGMLLEGWSWSASGDLSINGSSLEMDGSSGTLSLDLPLDAPPNRHFFNQSADGVQNADLAISLHILQVFRAAAEVVTPDDGAVFNVSERTKLILKLENPGNGEDTFTLSGRTGAGNLSVAPNVTFEITNPSRTLGPGGVSMVPVWVTLSEDIPARESFELIFDWNSVGDPTVQSQANVSIEARPDHRWDVEVLEGYSIDVVPNQELNLTIVLENTGNNDDLLTLAPSFQTTYFGDDQSTWSAEIVNSSRLEVGESETITLSVNVPANTWAGTMSNMTLELSSSGFVLQETVNVNLNVAEVSGWRFDLSNTSLEVPPEGGNVTLRVEQLGNAPTNPYFTKAGQGWNISYPVSGPVLDPGQSSEITVTVFPPEDAVAGEVGVINLRIANGNGAGQVVEQIPIRVGSAPGITMDSKDSWKVRQDVASWPTAWVENTGNDVAIMDLSIPNLPAGWTLSGDDVLVVAPGQVVGIPLQVQPSQSWDGNNLQFDIQLIHPSLGTIVHSIVIEQSDSVLTSSPVHVGRTGEKISVTVDASGTVSTSEIPLPSERVNTTHQGMMLHLVGIPAPEHSASCSSQDGSLSTLGIDPLSTNWTTCNVIANSEHSLTANVWLRTSSGEILDNEVLRLAPGEEYNSTLIVSNWDPEPGFIDVEVLIVDSNGIELYSSSTQHVARQSGWNVEVRNFNVDSDQIAVGISREGYEMMAGSSCSLLIEKVDGGWSQELVVDVYGSKYAPSVTIDRPEEIKGQDEVRATIACSAPWDVDSNPDDDSMTVYAGDVPIVTYESSDLVWTAGVGVLMLVLAYLGGVLNMQPKQAAPVRKKPDSINAPAVKPKPKEEVQVVEEDDMSFEEDDDSQPEAEPEPQPEPEIVVEEETIDIDDSTASGRLSALRQEMSSDDGNVSKSVDDISSRLDAFLKDR